MTFTVHHYNPEKVKEFLSEFQEHYPHHALERLAGSRGCGAIFGIEDGKVKIEVLDISKKTLESLELDLKEFG